MLKPDLILSSILLVFLTVFLKQTKAFAYEAPQPCSNPNGRMGLCVSIYECPSLLNALKTRQPSAYEFARKCECSPNGQGRRPYVCCTSDTGFIKRNELTGTRIIFPEDSNENAENPSTTTTTTTTTLTSSESNRNENFQEASLFPKPPECGPVSIANKIYGGEEAELGEFPWLANLEYKKHNGDLVSVCAGNIINRRYILTAAHCCKGEIEVKVGQLVSVRVGDHNTLTPIDCNNNGCIGAYQRTGIEQIIVHPNYGNFKGYHNYNDIALVRSDKPIQYSISVAPICLPDAVQGMPQLKKGLKLTVAGWGHTGNAKYSAEKRKVDLPYVENEFCPMNVAPEQLCAGGEYFKDSCTGDSGGGLVRLANNAWIVEGLVSYGRGCGLEKPGVYTRVQSYLPWIRTNVKP